MTAPELGIAVQQASGIVRVTEAKTEVFLESGAAKAVEPAVKGKSGQPMVTVGDRDGDGVSA